MKRVILAVLLGLMAASSCYRDEIQNLQSQIDQIRNTQLASVTQQISAIQSTVNELLTTNSELDSYIQALRNQDAELERAISGIESNIDEIRNELNAMGDVGSAEELAHLAALLEELRASMTAEQENLHETIDSLELEHSGLKDRVDALEDYIDNNLSGIDTVSGDMKDWLEATFATIKQYDSTVSEIASIKVSIEALNESMANMESRIKDELSVEIEEAVSSLDTRMQEALSSAVTDITDAYTAAISTAKSEIQAAYEAAIAQSLSALEASMKEWVNGQLSGYWTISQAQQELEVLKQEFSDQIAASQAYMDNMVMGMRAALVKEIDNNETLIESLSEQLEPMASQTAGEILAMSKKVDANSLVITDNSARIQENASDINANSELIKENSSLIASNAEMIETNTAAIEDLRASLESEYQYVLSQMELLVDNTAKIASQAELIARNAEQIETNRKQIASNAEEIADLRQSLETTKSEITAAYQEAITAAVSDVNNRMDEFETTMSEIESSVSSSIADFEDRIKAMEASFEAINSDIADIKRAIYDINTAIEEIQEQIKAIMGRIQSISYVPKYADGNAVMTYTNSGGTITPGSAVLDFELRPSSTAAEIAKVWEDALSVKAVYTLTRAVDFVSLAILSAEASTDGVLTVTVSGDALDESFFRSEQSANAALIISDGNNELASDYINVVPQTTEDIGGFSLLFENGLNIGCSAGETIRIPFTIVGWNDETVVDCMGNDGWEASVELFDDGHGYIVVVAPEPLVDGKVIVFADNGAGQASIKSLNFEEGRMILVSDTYYVDADGGLIDINIATNRIYDVYIPEDARGWVTLVPETKSSLRNDVVTLMIGKYAEGTVRTANVELRGIGVVYEYVTIVQEAFTEPVNIEFSDPLVKQILVESSSPRVDLNMDGEISSSEAAQCSFLPAFRETEITTFDELRYFTGLSSIGNYAFYDCESLTSIILPSGITYIGKEAFNGCINLSHISLPASISSLGTKAFYACRSLSSLGLPDNINEIGESAFAECSNLSIINIPKSLTSIEVNLFSGCKSLSNIELHENITSIGSGAFMGTGFTHFEWPENITTVSGSVFFDCDNLTEVVIPEGVAVISGNAFSDCENIKSLILPESLTAIGNNAFDHSGLTNIVLPENIKSISMFTFWGCEDLISVVLPEGIQNIGKQSFQDCTSLIDIVLPDNVESIGYNTFDGCASLREIVIPAKVNEIGEYAFRECVSLTEITFKGELPPKIEDNSFDFCSALQTIFVPVEGEENYRMILPDYKNLIKGY